MADTEGFRVPVERLRATFDEASFEFECTDELTPLVEFVGQDRAVRSLQFGLGMHKPGYNIFVTGMTGTGKATAILGYIQRRIEERKDADSYDIRDWCYVHNFDDPDQPRVLSLPPGQGRELREHLDKLLSAIRGNIARAFTGDDYQRQRRQVFERGQTEAESLMSKSQQEAQTAGFALSFTPTGPNLVPLKDGKPMTSEEFTALSAAEHEALADRQRPIAQLVAETIEHLRALEREIAAEIDDLDRMVVEAIVRGPFDSVEAQYPDAADVLHFVKQLREYTLKSADALRQLAAQPTVPQPLPDIANTMLPDPFVPFRVNLLVDNAGMASPPIVIEPNPTWANLFGRIDRRAQLGTYISDHTMLKPGALHHANGGYLILNFNDLITKPGVWDGLRRVVRTQELRIEDLAEQGGMFAPQTPRPQPVPIDVKLIVTGDPGAYFMLSSDELFWEMFKVKADFDFQIPRTPENAIAYAGFVCAICEREQLRHFERSAIARLIEYGSRTVDDQEKLSARFGRLRDLIIESDYWAAQANAQRVAGEHVTRAITERIYRVNLIEDRLREMIARGTLMIDTAGEVVGQVNGLSVIALGDLSFGRPSRITARTYLGQRGVVSIDRESKLSGRIHDKGVFVLSGYLGAKYGQDRPLSLSATISFEQGYDPVDGDSASLGETCAILSSLSGLPVRQDLAITGSMNQKGEVQPIGGANQKIEGFYDVCKAIGLTGTQGVVMPARNLKNLMLREDVVASAAAGQFTVYQVSSVDEAIEILTGTPAGERDANGKYPEATVHFLVEEKLKQMSAAMRRASGPPARSNDRSRITRTTIRYAARTFARRTAATPAGRASVATTGRPAFTP